MCKAALLEEPQVEDDEKITNSGKSQNDVDGRFPFPGKSQDEFDVTITTSGKSWSEVDVKDSPFRKFAR